MADKSPREDAEFAPALTRAFRERLRPCLNALDSLRSHGLQREISLPAIAVVGDQSVGKSSVLEAISGVEFPRGLGIVTRCPLMLCMRGREDSGWTARIRYETKSGEVRDKPLSTPAEIGQAIRDAQEEMTSSAGEISEKLIELHIEGRDTPDLTLVDLPGIARFSIANAGDIATVSKSLIMSHILKPEVLILVVIPCNVDIETVEAVSLAREVDPECKRTLGVLTCPDLVNPGSETEVLAMMRNERLKLSKGFVTVRCRTPQQLKENMSLQEACKAEEEFFKQHPHFRTLGEYQRGSKTLANKLSIELYQAVRNRIPEILKEIQIKRDEYSAMLEGLGTGPPDSDEEVRNLLVNMMEKFKSEFTETASGKHWSQESRLFGPCRRHWELLADQIEKCAFMRDDSHDNKGLIPMLEERVLNQRGRELLGFDNIFPVLESLVCEYFVEKLTPHTNEFVNSVTQEVDHLLRTLSDRYFSQFPSLNTFIKSEVESIKTKKMEESKKTMSQILQQERFLFTQDRIYKRELEMPSNEKLQTNKPGSISHVGASALSRATNQTELTQQSALTVLEGAEAYVRIAVRRLQDTIPMTIVFHMLHGMSSAVSHRLSLMLTEPQPLFAMLQEENPETASRRRQLKEYLQRLAVAEKELAKF